MPSGVTFTLAGFEIAVHDALLVGGLERRGDLSRDRERLRDRKRPADGQPLGQRHTFHELEDEPPGVALFRPAVDGRDVRVVQRRQDLRFPFEPLEPFVTRGCA